MPNFDGLSLTGGLLCPTRRKPLCPFIESGLLKMSQSMLDDIQSRWRELHGQLKTSADLSSLFYSASLASASSAPILIAGKCTFGWDLEGTEGTRRFMAGVVGHTDGCRHGAPPERTYRSAFWRFAAKLGKMRTPSGGCPFDYVAWTNLAKIGPKGKGNANRGLFKKQRELAIESLDAEIKHFAPELVVFVTAGYYDDVVWQVCRAPEGKGFAGDHGCRWRARTDGLPAVLLTQHPQCKKSEVVDRWQDMAKNLLDGGR